MKLKPRAGVVELRRGHAEVEQDAVELEAGLDLVGTVRQRGERREKDRNARIGCEACSRFRDGRRDHDRDRAIDRSR